MTLEYLDLWSLFALLLKFSKFSGPARQGISPGGPMVKDPAASAGDAGLILGSGRSPGEGNGNPLQYSVWKTLWTEEPGGLQSMGSQRVRHGLVTK